ncbi:MAG: IS200/IS605 family transposase [Anaerolineae bacterium]
MARFTHARTAVYNVNYHIVWSTKYRSDVLTDKIEERLRELMREIAEDKEFIIDTLEIRADHVHVFVSAHPKHAPGYIYKMLKGISARKLFLEYPQLKHRLWGGPLWNPSTFVETVGHISEDTVRRYIEDQKKLGAER